MTDVTLVNAYYTDQSQIKKFENEVVQKYALNPGSVRSNLLGDMFMSASMSNNAVIRLFRERTTGDYYRLDSRENLKTFDQYSWEGGLFTNKHQLYVNNISVPPQGTNSLWTLYTTQPAYSSVDIQTGEKPLLFNEGFYLYIFALPPLINVNVILQTGDARGTRGHAISNNDPAGFSWFKPDEKKMEDVLNGKGKFGRWAIASPAGGIEQLSFVSPDGVDHDFIRVLYNDSNPRQKYLAYVRDPSTDNIINLFAWDYDENGNPIRFLRIERGGNDMLKAWAQNIIHVEKTSNIDWALFNVDVSKFNSVYDKRPEFPIQTVNGKVVFDARNDKYASLPGKGGIIQSKWTTKSALIRLLMVSVMLLVPALVMVFMTFKKRR